MSEGRVVMNKQLRSFVYDLCLEKRFYDSLAECYRLNINDLSSIEKSQFITLLIHNSKGDWINYLSDDVGNIKSALLELLKTPDIDNKCNFSDVVMDSLYEQYKEKMQTLIDSEMPYVEAA